MWKCVTRKSLRKHITYFSKMKCNKIYFREIFSLQLNIFDSEGNIYCPSISLRLKAGCVSFRSMTLIWPVHMIELNQPWYYHRSSTGWSKEQTRGVKNYRQEKLEELWYPAEEVCWTEQLKTEKAQLPTENQVSEYFIYVFAPLGDPSICRLRDISDHTVFPVHVQHEVHLIFRYLPSNCTQFMTPDLYNA